MLNMRRREFITLIGSAAAWPVTASAQQAAKLYRLGVLETTPAAMNAANFDALRQGLRQLGYAEGKNLVIDYRSADGRMERFPELAAELVRLKVDAIVTRGTPATMAAQQATSTIPIVMAAVAEPLLLVGSMARPGGNLTGLGTLASVLQPKRMEVLKEAVPQATRIGALMNMGNAVLRAQWPDIESAARRAGIEPHLLDARKLDDLPSAFEFASTNHIDGLIVTLDTLTSANRSLIVELALKHRLPTVWEGREFVEIGGLLFYGVNYPDLYRRAAAYVERIFKGANPRDLPVEQPTKFELVINLQTAKALGLEIPPTLLARADEVIE